MVLQMSCPTKNAKSGVYYFRQKTPADLVAIVGKKEVGWSLGTKDPEQAKVLNTLAVQKQAVVWERYRKRPEPLVIHPVLTGRDRRTHAGIFSFIAGVTPPMPMLGRSLL